MQNVWQRFAAALTPGVRVMVILLTAVYLAALAGRFLHAFDLHDWLAVAGPEFWHGQAWRVATYALLPVGFLDFVMNLFVIILLGSQLERHWTGGELGRFCFIAVLGAGLAGVLLSPVPMTGAAPMVFALLLAWASVSGREMMLFPLFGPMTVRQMVWVMAAASLLIMFITAGLARTLIMAAGGAAGWLYLWLRQKWLMARASRVVQSERINRLEL